MLLVFTKDGANTNNAIPYAESFESYTNGFSLVNTNGWSGENSAMAVVTTNGYTNTYHGIFPIPGAQQFGLLVDGTVTNHFQPSVNTNVWVDLVLQGEYWTDQILPTAEAVTNTPFAICVTTNVHLAVWTCTNAPALGNGWTELLDTAVAASLISCASPWRPTMTATSAGFSTTGSG